MIARIIMKLLKKFFKNNEKLNANEIAVCTDEDNNKFKQLDNYLSNIKEQLSGTILFDGSESGEITLSESAANFSKIKIIPAESGGIYLPPIELENPDGKLFKCEKFGVATGIAFYSKTYQINGNKITTTSRVCAYINSGKTIEYIRSSSSDDWNIAIKKVIGYK